MKKMKEKGFNRGLVIQSGGSGGEGDGADVFEVP